MSLFKTRTSRWNGWLVQFVLFLASFSITLLLAPTASAHDIGVRWYQSSASVRDFSSGYGFNYNMAANDYKNNTDMKLNWTTSGSGPGYIHIVAADYGPNGQPAWAQNFRNGVACNNGPPDLGPTGACNTTDKKANQGYVYNNVNSAYVSTLNSYIASVSRHELGHLVGMAHPDSANLCIEVTVMRPGNCIPNLFTTLQTHDKNLMNVWY